MSTLAEYGPVRRLAALADDATTVELRLLRVAGSPRSTGVDERHVRALAEVIDSVPPILVHRGTLRVLDGVHRVHAARSLGRTAVRAQLLDGADADVFVAAVRANTTHGLPLSLGDRKAAATTILRSHPHWSDRLIADVVGLSPKTVGAARTTACAVRTGRDGRARPTDAAERRRRAAALLREDPALSLRQVAGLAGISPETARSVKARLARGADPVGRCGPSGPRHVPPPGPDLITRVRRLRADPSLRFTEPGRALLRLLELHAAGDGRWESLADGVPAHCGPVVAAVAVEIAHAWRTFAEQLERRHSPE
ncbi:ParB/RepB/Spo0J family partition protein [Actinophytocola gossypii]|uniref:ParB N-terminal domain-containing protein n=1 Tax=Actinophytocola gossypii TaxID=2812003 RepID=A0ABT2J274_9PSEU|nr:ParB/RepB/Spo0J family partition protein [Actinophytocola gossypii]MCT2581953.1 ParB N-terminal domain-containing protein [Actinophytocola gossypii]